MRLAQGCSLTLKPKRHLSCITSGTMGATVPLRTLNCQREHGAKYLEAVRVAFARSTRFALGASILRIGRLRMHPSLQHRKARTLSTLPERPKRPGQPPRASARLKIDRIRTVAKPKNTVKPRLTPTETHAASGQPGEIHGSQLIT